jgi:NTE family protein
MKIGLALSGGGARGIAHIGMLKALDEAGIRPGRMAGTSAGAIIGAFYSRGYTPDQIMDVVRQTSVKRMIRLAFNKSGLLDLKSAESLFGRYLPQTFEELTIPLVVTAINLRKGVAEYFERGSLIRALMAASSVPVVFNPVEIDGELYVDGGIMNNLPVEPLTGACDVIIGLHCNPVDDNYRLGSFRSLLERSLLMAVYSNAHTRKNLCDIFLEPPAMKNIGAFDFSKSERIFEIGYLYALEQISGIRSVLNAG